MSWFLCQESRNAIIIYFIPVLPIAGPLFYLFYLFSFVSLSRDTQRDNYLFYSRSAHRRTVILFILFIFHMGRRAGLEPGGSGRAGGLGAGLGAPAVTWPHQEPNEGLPWVPSTNAWEYSDIPGQMNRVSFWSESAVRPRPGRRLGGAGKARGRPTCAHLGAGRASTCPSGTLLFPIYFIRFP